MSAIRPLSGDKQASGERVENDALAMVFSPRTLSKDRELEFDYFQAAGGSGNVG
jgi:hypothetical protein